MNGAEVVMWAVLAGVLLTGCNVVLAWHWYTQAQAEKFEAYTTRQETLAIVKKAFALHNCGAREEAMAVLGAVAGWATEAPAKERGCESAPEAPAKARGCESGQGERV